MAKRTQKPIKRSSGEWLYCSFSVKPEEREAYQQIAKSLDRSLSWWIRDLLNKEVSRRKASLNNGTQLESENATVGVETVSPHRA
jgi:hypothetical protein